MEKRRGGEGGEGGGEGVVGGRRVGLASALLQTLWLAIKRLFILLSVLTVHRQLHGSEKLFKINLEFSKLLKS